MRVEEETSEKLFGQCVEETLKETSEEGVTARARKVEAVPNRKEVKERNLDHAEFGSWCPHCVKGRAEGYGHEERTGEGGQAPMVSLEYMLRTALSIGCLENRVLARARFCAALEYNSLCAVPWFRVEF